MMVKTMIRITRKISREATPQQVDPRNFPAAYWNDGIVSGGSTTAYFVHHPASSHVLHDVMLFDAF